MDLLGGSSGKSTLENKTLWNICSALLALSDALQDEFTHLNTRLTYLEQQTNRWSSAV